jgi:hypothetical protein
MEVDVIVVEVITLVIALNLNHVLFARHVQTASNLI